MPMKKGVEKLRIRKVPGKNLYKVYTPNGALSEKGMPKAMAEKQKTAVILSELRQAGRLPKQTIKKKPASKPNFYATVPSNVTQLQPPKEKKLKKM